MIFKQLFRLLTRIQLRTVRSRDSSHSFARAIVGGTRVDQAVSSGPLVSDECRAFSSQVHADCQVADLQSGPWSSDMAAHMRLPRELNDMIIDHLSDDKKTLATCGLVHSSWRSTSCPHLFRALTITQSREDRNLTEFVFFLKRWRDIGQHIRRLLVRGDRRQRNNNRPDQRRGIRCLSIAELLVFLPQLDSLRLVGVNPPPRSELSRQWTSRTIQRLEFDRCGHPDSNIEGFVDILSLFSEITVLSLKSVIWDPSPGTSIRVMDTLAQEGISLKLGAIDLENRSCEEPTGWSGIECLSDIYLVLLASRPAPAPQFVPIQSLALKFTRWEDMLYVADQALPALGPDTLDFTLDFSKAIMVEEQIGAARESSWLRTLCDRSRDSPATDDEWEAFDFSCCRRLSSLTLRFEWCDEADPDEFDWDPDCEVILEQTVFFLRRLAQKPPPSLRTLTLHVILHDPELGPFRTEGAESWNEMDAILSHEIIGLEKVFVDIDITRKDPYLNSQADHQSFVEQWLPATRRKNMLYFLEDE